jgi:nicotinate dehydrogenase subunit B
VSAEERFATEPERYELTEPPRYRFELQRRDLLRGLAVAGAGLVVFVTVPRTAAEQGSGPAAQQAASDVAAWLHIDEQGGVTAYTGKVEIGQNIRTSLAQAVADELRLPIAAITMVMGDTALTPYDAGTFGSLSTPRMAPQLSRAAATARAMLLERAASTWQVDRGTLAASGGRVVAPDGRSLTYGELTAGQRLTGAVVAEPQAGGMASAWALRGQSVRKVDGRRFVTGEHPFVPDMTRPGLLHGRILRPDRIGAALVSVDDSAARGMPGVRIVRDGDFVGVVAPDDRAAGRAVDAIRAEWRPLEGQPSSDTIYEHLRKTGGRGGGRGATPFATGDVARARAEGARTFEATYRIPYIAHVPLEPRAALAEWADGRLTVWTGTQRPFGVRAELATAFRLPEDHVRVLVPDTGSAYGGKHTGEVAIEAARLAREAGRPVKVVWTRAEEFSWAYFRPAGVIDVSAAVDGEGRLTAWEFHNWNSGAASIRTPYDVPNQRIAFHSSDSPLRQGSYRALAATANHYAREMHMDAVARALGIDPVEFRLRHLKDERMRAVLQAAAGKVGWPRVHGGDRAWGIACGTEKGSFVATAAELSRAQTGFRLERLTVAFECGAIVNPDGLQSQVEGCVVQGLGGALFEAIEFRDGRILNGTMASYPVPRFKDVPPIDVLLLDRKDLPSAGAGETPIVCVAPAVGSAARAFGRVDTALPVTLLT